MKIRDDGTMSMLDAAAKIMRETGCSITCGEIIAHGQATGIIRVTASKTPAGTLSVALNREIRARGDRSRFVRVGRGRYRLNVK